MTAKKPQPAPKRQRECDCTVWGRDNHAALLFLRHHPKCEKYRPEAEIRMLLIRLIHGIEEWASDEDGIHSECWDAYVSACNAVGQPARPNQQEPV